MKEFFQKIDLRKSSSIGLLLGAVASGAHIIAMNTPYVITIASISFVILLFSLFLQYNTHQLPHIPNSVKGIEVRRTLTPAEFDGINEIYHHCFGSSAVPTEILKSWWLSYPRGIILILKNGEIIGGSSVWSIDDETFEKIKCGYIKEREIIATQLDSNTYDKWYISEIALVKGERNLFNLITLINGIINNLEEEIKMDYPAYVLALGYSNEGTSLMKRFGFIQEVTANKTADKLPLFKLTINSKSDLVNLKAELADLHQMHNERKLKNIVATAS